MTILTIAATSLVILCALFFLAKAKSENLGPLFTWITYLVLAVAVGLLVFQVVRGTSRLWNGKSQRGAMHGGQVNHKMKAGCMMNCSDVCMQNGMKNCCKNKKNKKNKRMKAQQGVIRQSSVDTVDGKIIVKETEIIQDTN